MKCDQLRALRSTSAESSGRTAHSSQEGRRVLQEAGRREEVAERRGCSRPGELRRVADGLEEHRTGCEEGRRMAIDREERRKEIAVPGVLHRETVGLEVLHTGTVVQEEHRRGMARAVRRKETAQGVHRMETAQEGHRTATEQEAVHRKVTVQEVVVPGGRAEHRSDLKVAGQKLAEEAVLRLRSKSLMRLWCQSPEKSP